jgi:hypothetical protein
MRKLRTERDAVDLIAACAGKETIVIPVEDLDEDFFRLRTGVAGAMLQKFVNYRKRVVIVGDVSRWTEASDAFRDFVIEANRGNSIQFVANLPAARDNTTSSQP